MHAEVGDLERGLARLCASSHGGLGRDTAGVVLYEDALKRRLGAFLAVLNGLQRLQVLVTAQSVYYRIAEQTKINASAWAGCRGGAGQSQFPQQIAQGASHSWQGVPRHGGGPEEGLWRR